MSRKIYVHMSGGEIPRCPRDGAILEPCVEGPGACAYFCTIEGCEFRQIMATTPNGTAQVVKDVHCIECGEPNGDPETSLVCLQCRCNKSAGGIAWLTDVCVDL